MSNISIFWHRRDLRIKDNAGLYRALKQEKNVQPIFIFDKNILDNLEDKHDARVSFIHHYVLLLKEAYQKHGSDLWVFYGTPSEVFEKLTKTNNINSVYTNRDYEPYAQERDKTLFDYFSAKSIIFKDYKDQVIFEKNEIVKEDGKPYTVYTPYSKKWKATLNDFYLKPYSVENYLASLHQIKPNKSISLEEIGFEKSLFSFAATEVKESILKNYHQTRNTPSIDGTSRLSVHLRFGTISIRQLVTKAKTLNEKYLNELIWRDFYQAILFHFPHTVNKAFKPAYDRIEWRNDEEQFNLWCEGKTGYPIVDAGMRELNATGFMHNRVRMIVASFLTKHLFLDWRWGEAYFAAKLLDFELASNVGGWQWAAGCGCDAAPYFRVFNPQLQTEKFDPELSYIKKWVPEFGTKNYPKPIVEHKFARNRILDAFKDALS
ncbi:MAG: cryptochrome/photolyase family protein [Flavobacteriales bacterium]